MSRVLISALGLSVLAALGPSSLRGDEPGQTRVTIRGTSSGVSIERTPSIRKPGEPAVAADLFDRAAALKASGASDAAVISYFRARESELPPVISALDINKLRKAGAGRSVVTFLTNAAAVDIGPTGEGYEAAVVSPPALPGDLESAPYGVSDGYPFYGAYGGSRYSRFARPIPRAVASPRAHRMTSSFSSRPAFHSPIRTRAAISRRPFGQ